jgi:hypothetical protein
LHHDEINIEPHLPAALQHGAAVVALPIAVDGAG